MKQKGYENEKVRVDGEIFLVYNQKQIGIGEMASFEGRAVHTPA